MNKYKNTIKIYGERNSGNNYLIKLLDSNIINLNPSVWLMHTEGRFSWTHGIPIPCDEANELKLNFIILVKNPYSWLLSLYRNPHKTRRLRNQIRSKPFITFLKAPFDFSTNPIQLYNQRIRYYLTFDKFVNKCIIIKFEDLIRIPMNCIDLVATKFNLQRHENFVNFSRRISSGGNMLNIEFNKDFYLQRKWKSKLNSEQILFINRQLDWELVNKLGYKRI